MNDEHSSNLINEFKTKPFNEIDKCILLPCKGVHQASVSHHLFYPLHRQVYRALYSVVFEMNASTDLCKEGIQLLTVLLSYDPALLHSFFANDLITLLSGCLQKVSITRSLLENVIELVRFSSGCNLGYPLGKV